MRTAARSIMPLSTCGPGTRIMQGQSATRRSDGDQSVIGGLDFQLSPARDDPGAQIEVIGEPLGCRQGVVRRLAVDVQYPGEGEDEIRPCLRARWKGLAFRHRPHTVSPFFS